MDLNLKNIQRKMEFTIYTEAKIGWLYEEKTCCSIPTFQPSRNYKYTKLILISLIYFL